VTFYNDHYDLLLSQIIFLPADHAGADPKAPAGTVVNRPAMSRFRSATRGATCSSSSQSRSDRAAFFNPFLGKGKARWGRERELLIVVCKKWHVANVWLEADGVRRPNLPAGLEYLFSEQDTALPDSGRQSRTLVGNAPVQPSSCEMRNAVSIITTPTS